MPVRRLLQKPTGQIMATWTRKTVVRDGETWSDSGYILKGIPIGFANGGMWSGIRREE